MSDDGPDGNRCWRLQASIRPDPPPPLATREAARGALGKFDGNGQVYDACPGGEEVFDPAAAAAQYWQEVVRPPSPAPLVIAPGSSITGLPAYLEIGGDPAPEWSLDNPIGADIVITASPRYVVDWGDGTTTQTTSQGLAYPGGPDEITHTYRFAGGTVVTVSAYWTGRWRLGGQDAGGARGLPELPVPTVSALDLPVGDLQAVRQR